MDTHSVTPLLEKHFDFFLCLYLNVVKCPGPKQNKTLFPAPLPSPPTAKLVEGLGKLTPGLCLPPHLEPHPLASIQITMATLKLSLIRTFLAPGGIRSPHSVVLPNPIRHHSTQYLLFLCRTPSLLQLCMASGPLCGGGGVSCTLSLCLPLFSFCLLQTFQGAPCVPGTWFGS